MGYFLRRLSFYMVALLVAATINFIIPRAMPGDPVTMMFAHTTVQVTPERIAAMKELLGFVEGNYFVQYLHYMKNILSWELGTSIQFFPLSVNTLLGSAFGWSLFLAGSAVILSFSIGSVLGIFAAWKRGSKFDTFVTPGMLIIQAMPQVVIAMMAMFIFAIGLNGSLQVTPTPLVPCQTGLAGHSSKMHSTTRSCLYSVRRLFRSVASWSTCVTT
ncbi:(GlcNAc)2 ABC transporter permease component 1 [Vibrio maritimus]|uniref:(GlcNAc)2 ABC transporter permease component 1 n=1 Tax=Vibrio maritimus TaxID=990268 RepID=A0A090SJ39_9VIBR|nr:(GlcNAc)2 ABC transporter permease component 1 [Vibrio maritimus]